MLITQLLRNEIELALGREADKRELTLFINHIHDHVSDCIHENKPITCSVISAAINVCLQDEFTRCLDCGEYELPDRLNERQLCIECERYR